MASDFDASEFVDEDFRSAPSTPSATAAAAEAASPTGERAPSRQEVESRVNQMQHKLADLRNAQQELERERSSLEELRRRQAEFSQGREEMIHHLTRGIGLLQEAELNSRREVEQMSKTLQDFHGALEKIQSIHEDSWTKSNLDVELTRANTAIENARMEWNSALVKLPLLSADHTGPDRLPAGLGQGLAESQLEKLLQEKSYAEMCKMGLALTWPIALAVLAIFLLLLIR